MVKTSDIALLAVAGVAGFFVLKKLNLLVSPTTISQTVDKFSAMGYKSYQGEATGAAYVRVGPTTYKFNKGDYDRLNWAQKFLLSTKLVPAKWVLE